MIVRIDKSFQKDVAKLKTAISDIIISARESTGLTAINNLKKLTGFKDMYRIRVGNYRIGLQLSDEQELIFTRFLHRKDIYDKWP